MFFWEILAFTIVFPTCWWLGGRIARHETPDAPEHKTNNVIDLEEWRRRHSQRPRDRATR